jgi:polyisoprenoid-binding protein YceI
MNPVLKKRISRLMLGMILCLLAYENAAAQTSEEILLELDPVATHIEFTLGSLLHTVHGHFALKQGRIRLDPANGRSSGELIVDATSGESGSASRDRRMHKEILDSQHYPELTFIPDRVDGKIDFSGTSEVQLHGLLKIHGTTHEVVLPVTAQMTQGQITATATLAIPYVSWGMKNPSTLFLRVNDNVDVIIRAVGHLTTSAGPSS